MTNIFYRRRVAVSGGVTPEVVSTSGPVKIRPTDGQFNGGLSEGTPGVTEGTHIKHP